MKVNGFEILLPDVTFHLYHVESWYTKKDLKNEYNRDQRLKG